MWITMNFSFAFILDTSNTNAGDVKVMNSTGIYKLRKYQLIGRLQKGTWKQHNSILHNVCISDAVIPVKNMVFYRVSIKSFPDYKLLIQENYVEYKHIFLPLLKLVS